MMTNSMVQRAAGGGQALYRIAGRPGALAALGTLAAVLCAATSPAAASEALARQHNCLNCHAVERKIVGPGFKQVAARYAGRADAAAYLAEKIVHGGAGAWGPVAMAANPRVGKEDAARLAAWVLAMK